MTNIARSNGKSKAEANYSHPAMPGQTDVNSLHRLATGQRKLICLRRQRAQAADLIVSLWITP